MARRCILTLNAGSSSLKFALFDVTERLERVSHGTVERVGTTETAYANAAGEVLTRLESRGGTASLTAVAHRFVHGGPNLSAHCLLSEKVLAEVRRVAPLDPAHLPAEIAVAEAVRSRIPSAPQVACFDTVFHAAMPRVAKLLAIPRRYEAIGIRRYGFHGLSYTYLLEALRGAAGEQAALGRIVFAHLGSGASLAAVRGGLPLDTTMGFSPNSGIPMGTRSGDLDPAVVTYLARVEGLGPDAIDNLLSRESGLLGVSGVSGDMRDLLEHEGTNADAADAVALFCHRTRQAIGALTATLGGLDTLVFSGGIGENAPTVRARIAEGLEHLGVHLDADRNLAAGPILSAPSSPCTVWMLKTDEESILAREAQRLVAAEGPV